MECGIKVQLEQHLSDIRVLASRVDAVPAEREAAARAEKFAISLLKQHNDSGHNGKPCPFATHV